MSVRLAVPQGTFSVELAPPDDRSPTWTAQVHFMTGRRWEGPFLIAVEATTPSAAAARAVSKAKQRLKRGARIRELRVSLQRQPHASLN